jgi:gluconolactonase
VSLFRDNSGNANGLALNAKGDLLVCESGRGRVVSISPQGELNLVAEQYDGRAFNQPNDLWIDPAGGVYFSDPIYGRADRRQSGECVYYIASDRAKAIRVLDDLVRPNGIVGTADGKTLFVTDHGAGKTYRYTVEPDGTLARKRLFVKVGADGMKLDSQGNLYLAEHGIRIYSPQAVPLETIDIPHPPTNLCFAGSDRRTLFITARSAAYTLRMRVPGLTFREQ